MKHHFNRLPQAEIETQLAVEWHNEQQQHLGLEFLLELRQLFERIQTLPLIFPKNTTLQNSQNIRRALMNRFQYAVIFRVTDNEILIIAITHTSRKPNYWQDRIM